MKKGIFAFFIFLLCLTPIRLFAYEDQDKMEMPSAAPSVEAAANAAAPAVAAPADMAAPSGEAVANAAAPAVVAPADVAAPAVEAGAPLAAVEVGNKICPVSGEKIGSRGPAYKVEHMGKIYNLCCSMCEKDFKSDPVKYISKVEEELKAAAGTEGAGGAY